MSQVAYFTALAVGSIATAIIFSSLQERVFQIEGFSFGGWMTFLTYVSFLVCGSLDNIISGNLKRRKPLKNYFYVSLFSMGGSYLTNWALNYLTYSTRLVFKSCKVLPVMVLRSIVVGQKYGARQYGAGVVLVTGISLFALGDADAAPSFSGVGVALIAVALVLDALTSNLEERLFFRGDLPARHSEVVAFLGAFSAAEAFLVMAATGELGKALAHAQQHPWSVAALLGCGAAGYLTVALVLLLIQHFGSTNAEIVKSMRKVCQVLVSFVMFPKPLSWKYVAGGVFVVAALLDLQRTSRHLRGGGGGGGGNGGKNSGKSSGSIMTTDASGFMVPDLNDADGAKGIAFEKEAPLLNVKIDTPADRFRP